MARGDRSYKIVQRVGNNAYKVELSGDMNISAISNVGYLAPYIKDKDEGNEHLRAHPLQGEEVTIEQVKQSNLLNHIKVLVHTLGP